MTAIWKAAATTIAAFAFAASASAAEFKPFDRATFDAAQAKGRPILVEVNAWWCPVCSSQARTIKAEVKSPDYNNLLVLRINYDKQKAEWRAFKVQKQSTLIAFRGGREQGRLAYVTDKEEIRTLMRSAIR